MQFKVPQNVQREDKIVGPLTLKQLIICGIGFAVAYGIYVSLAKYYIWVTWILPVGIVAIVTMAFAFARPLDLSFSKFIMRWIEFTVQPRKRFWILGSGDFYPLPMSAAQSASKIEKRAEKKAEAMMDKRKKLEEISKILNTHTPQEDKITK